MSRALLLLIVAAIGINLIGALGPELGFDALWYHLTVPKLYLLAGRIYHIPGGLLYYSELPRLTEILYLFINSHLLNWGAGIGVTVIIYKLSEKLQLSPQASLLAATIWYITPLVSWQSGSAYVDLFRTFFEVLALYLIFNEKYLLAGLATGLAISTKTLALGSIAPLILITFIQAKSVRSCISYLVSCILVGLPWFLSAYLNTGYPFYPIGAGILDSSHNLNLDLWNLPRMVSSFWKLWLLPEDPISPIYLITLPFLLVNFPKLKKYFPLLIYCLTSFLIWYITPMTGGGRFILPYLPAWAIVVSLVIVNRRDKFIQKLLLFAAMGTMVINLVFRFGATAKVLPYLLSHQTKAQYLCQNLDFKTGVFVDCDSWFAINIKPTDLVLVSGVHNLLYIDFPFIDDSMYRGEKYNYVLAQNAPDPIGKWKLIYQNSLTKVRVFAKT